MREICISRCSASRILLFLLSIYLQCISGSGYSQNATSSETHKNSSDKAKSEVMVVLIAIVTLGGLGFFLFKLWQKKKRKEQYARLLKLFEDDDELEIELGLRD